MNPNETARREGNEAFTRELLAALRTGDADAAVTLAVDALFRSQVHATAVWDAVHLAAAESLVRYGGGNALHENT